MRSRNVTCKSAWRTLALLPGVLFALLMAIAMQANATLPSHITFTLEGCRLEAATSYNPVTNLCSDDGYTTGNLGKEWNELDFVPHRITLDNGSGTSSYDFVIAGDNTYDPGSAQGWDDISSPVKNNALSDAACPALTVGPVTKTPSGDGVGGADQTIYRAIHITHPAGLTCVYDYYQRLAIGAHEFTGSSLQSNLWNENLASSGIGQKRISIPVQEIEPQELSKTMIATQDKDFVWSVEKAAVPAYLDFKDSCEAYYPDKQPLSMTTEITVTWTKEGAPAGDVAVKTVITAKNPAHRAIRVLVTDVIQDGLNVLDTDDNGTGILLDPQTSGTVLTHLTTVADADSSDLNDIATATYKDEGTGVLVPGNTEATASAAVQTGTSNNDTATITEVEGPIAAAGWTFSVDSFVGGTLTFADNSPYTLGTPTNQALKWTSGTQNSGGSVTFKKTVYLDQPRNSSGALPDTATLVTSGGVVSDFDAVVTFDDHPLVDLTIYKDIDKDILGGGESATFKFDVVRVSDGEVVADDVEIVIPAGATSNSTVVKGLDPYVQYRVDEVGVAAGFDGSASKFVEIPLPECAGSVEFLNEARPASAKVIKVTVPAGEDASGFDFLLTGPGLGGGVAGVYQGAGEYSFAADLFEGNYVITEAVEAGWVLTAVYGGSDVVGDLDARTCSFSVDLPDDADHEFLCTFENTKLATIVIVKRVEGNNALDLSGSFYFDSAAVVNGVNFNGLLDARSWSFADVPSGSEVSQSFTDLFPGTYDVQEAALALGSNWGFTDVSCVDPTGNTSWDADPVERSALIELDPGETVTCTFVNTKLAAPGNLIIHKQTIGDTGTFVYESADLPLASFDIATASENTFYEDIDSTFNGLQAGLYSASEIIPAGWKLTDLTCDDPLSIDGSATTVSLATGEVFVSIDNGETVHCYYTNTRQGYIRLIKETVPDGDPGMFQFVGSLSGMIGDGQSIPAAGYLEVDPFKVYASTELVPTGWDLTNIACVEDKLQNSYRNGADAIFTVEPGEYVSCTFTNTKRGYITLVKNTVGDTGNFLFGHQINGLAPALDTVGDYTESADSALLPPGQYPINELVPAGWELTDVTCVDSYGAGVPSTDNVNSTLQAGAVGSALVNLDPGEHVTCTFTNTRKGYIRLIKQTIPAGDPAQFEFTGTLSGAIGDGGAIPASGYLEVSHGQYASIEIVPAGWDLTSIVCEESMAQDSGGSGSTATFNVQPGEYVTCTFTNTKRGMADLLKLVSGVEPGGLYPVFDFQIRYNGAVVATASSDVQDGTASFSCAGGVDPAICVDVGGMAKLIPGDYQFCELDTQPGWSKEGTDGNGDPLVWTTVFDGADPIGECAPFNLMAGETESFVVNNIPPPGGNAHTIGFWKNWTSCDGRGRQFEHWMTDPDYFNILDEFITGAYSPADTHLYLHPGLEITQCAQGVDILDKRDVAVLDVVGDGRKMAGDPAYGLAAQLLAVQLNIAADAGTCPALLDAKLAAENLLNSISFDGTGGYLKKGNKAKATLANNLASILDSYNNNQLCP